MISISLKTQVLTTHNKKNDALYHICGSITATAFVPAGYRIEKSEIQRNIGKESEKLFLPSLSKSSPNFWISGHFYSVAGGKDRDSKIPRPPKRFHTWNGRKENVPQDVSSEKRARPHEQKEPDPLKGRGQWMSCNGKRYGSGSWACKLPVIQGSDKSSCP